jgi:hypothetical protein
VARLGPKRTGRVSPLCSDTSDLNFLGNGAKASSLLAYPIGPQNAQFGCAETGDAKSGCAELQGTLLHFAQLQGAQFGDARGADFTGAQLQQRPSEPASLRILAAFVVVARHLTFVAAKATSRWARKRSTASSDADPHFGVAQGIQAARRAGGVWRDTNEPS